MQGINSINNNIYSSKVSFKSDEGFATDEQKENKKATTTLKTLAGLTALGVLGYVAYSLKTGKTKALKEVGEELGNIANNKKPPIENLEITGNNQIIKPESNLIIKINDKPVKNTEPKIKNTKKTLKQEIAEARAKIREQLKDCPSLNGQEFREVNKVITLPDGTKVRILFEGISIDITSEGKMLQKVLVRVPNPETKPKKPLETGVEELINRTVKHEQKQPQPQRQVIMV